MKRKRNLQTRIFLLMRRLGMLCKKPRPSKPVIRIQSTVHAHETADVTGVARFVFLQNKLTTRPGCKFDPVIEKCECGRSVDEFLKETKCNAK